MKITGLTAYLLRAPETGKPHWTSHFKVPTANEILVRLSTDEGIEGFGLTSSYKPFDFAISALKTGLGELVFGEDPLAPKRLYAKMFA